MINEMIHQVPVVSTLVNKKRHSVHVTWDVIRDFN